MSDNSYRDGGAPNQRVTGGESRPLSATKQCELLANRYRRNVLQYLVTRPGETVAVDDIIEYIVSLPATECHDSVEISLFQNHLPKLDREGVIEFNRHERTLQYVRHPNLEQLLFVLEEQ